MADTTTTNYGLVKPELKSIGWGEKINDDLDAIDDQMRLNEVSASDKVPLTRTVNSKALSANIVLTTADVADSADKRYCTDAQKTAIGTIPVKATGAEADTGTNDDKFLTAKAAKDSHNIPSVAPGTIGNVLTSDGTNWTSSAPATAGIESVVAGTNVTVDDTDPANPVVSASTPKATGADIDTGTEDAEFVTPKALADQVVLAKYADARFKVGTFTRDMTAESGDVAYTGVGFVPKAIIAFGGKDSFAQGIGSYIGITTGATTNSACLVNMLYDGAGKMTPYGSLFLRFSESGTQYQQAVLKTFDADGFTLTWTKSGTTSANTMTAYYIALR